MIVKCTKCDHETQLVKNNTGCDWCYAPMIAIGDCWMSKSDGSLSTDEVEKYEELRVR
jgi:Zn finger protein HypA/HybF involved in hydrogenase expression